MTIVSQQYNQKPVYGISRARLEKILGILPSDLTGKKILDIGCGGGGLGQALKERGAIVHGCDLSVEAVSRAAKLLDKTFVFDIENDDMAALASDYDIVVASEVIEHLVDPKKFLINVKQILNVHGVFVLTTPNFLVWSNRIKMLLGRFKYTDSGLMDYGHLHFFSRNLLTEYVKISGYLLEKENNVFINGNDWPGRWLPDLFTYQMVFLVKVKR